MCVQHWICATSAIVGVPGLWTSHYQWQDLLTQGTIGETLKALMLVLQEVIIPLLRESGIGIVAYSPLGRGFLTGAITSVDDLQ